MTTVSYRVTHKTIYEYDEMVPVCHNEVHLAPRLTPWQRCTYHRLRVWPEPEDHSRLVDYFGNTMAFFTVTRPHRRLVVSAASRVEVTARTEGFPPGPPWEQVRERIWSDRSGEGLRILEFCFPSSHVPLLEELEAYAGGSFQPGRPMVEALAELTRRIYEDFTYDPTATTVSTPVIEVLEKRRGVCQDLAHLQIGALRSLGLAARYVSGYVRSYAADGSAPLTGSQASHAWLAVWCGDLGWIDVDPTNNTFPSMDHVTVAWGRDYSDVAPVAGVYVGGGGHHMEVSVDVRPVGNPPGPEAQGDPAATA